MFKNISISSKNFTLVFAALAGILVIAAIGLFEIHELSIRDRENRIRSVVEVVHGMLSEMAERQGGSEGVPDAEAKRLAIDTIAGLRFDGDEYFWINDIQSRLLMHPYRPDLIGQDLSEFTDARGKRIFSEFVETARHPGGGFVSYQWPRPDSDLPEEKVSYVKAFAPWGWIVGAGVYVDDIETRFRRQAGIFGVAVAAVFLLIAGTSWLVTFNIVRPLKAITWSMSRLSRGDSSVSEGDVERRDELGDLARAMDVFKRHILEINRLRVERERLKGKENEILRESEQRFRDFAEASSDWFWETDDRDHFTFVSDRISDSLGYRPDDLIGKPRKALGIILDESGRWPDGSASGAARRPFRDVQFVALDKGEQPRIVRVSGRPRFDRNGLYRGFRGTGTDVTAEVEASRREARAQKRLMTALEKIPLGVALFDSDDHLVVFNERYREINPVVDDLPAGVSFEKLIRENVRRGFIASVSPVEEEEFILDRLDRHRHPAEPFETQRRDHWITIHEYRTEEGDTLTITVDVTDRKRAEQSLRDSEEKFRVLFENANDSIFLSDPDNGRILDANENATRNLGFERDEILALSISNVLEFSRPDDSPTESENGGFCPVDMAEALQIHKDGSKTPVEINSRLVRIRDHTVVQSIARDISQRKAMQKQLVDAQKMKAVGELTGGVAHDFNNLLTVVIGSLEWLQDLPQTGEQAQKLIGSALEAAQRGADLTRNLLAYARRQMLAPKVLQVEDTIARIESLIARALPESIRTEIEINPDLWPIRVDPAMLEDAIVNLALNARDAIDEFGHFRIRGRNVAAGDADPTGDKSLGEGEYVLLAFEDDGCGMSAEVAEQACDPFFTTKDFGQGRGLGLSMVKGFVEQSGGKLEVTSKQGRGATITLFFPRAR